MYHGTIILIGFLISFVGFFLSISSAIYESDVHKKRTDDLNNNDNKNNNNNNEEIKYIENNFKVGVLSSFAEITIALGFILINSAVIHKMYLQGYF